MKLNKVLSDKLYKRLWNRTHNKEVLEAAGFFDDELETLDYKLDLLTTPVEKIAKPKTDKPVVLLTTGGFAPVHEGHLYMMETAKKVLTEAGHEVIGGYISPSHDSYVHKKYPGSEKLSIYEKIELLRKALESSDFLMVDPWEGVFTPKAINFTDVIYRLEQYLQKHLGYAVQIAYVFGGDNVGFTEAFIDSQYLAVCVARQQTEKFNQKLQQVKEYSNIFMIPENPYAQLSSRTLNPEPETFTIATIPYLVRDDLSFYGISQKWSEQLIHLIQSCTKNSVVALPWTQQQSFADSIKGPFINLDPLVKGGVKIEVSRKFPVATGQYRSKELINRPHSLDLEKQVLAIPPGDYLLIEDDVASGFTVNYIKSLLPKGVNITEIKTLTEFSFYQHFSVETPFKFFDIVDLRDFILGLSHGGLVIELPNGQIARSIYALPFVNLASRAKIDPKVVIGMSKLVWQLNYAYYQNKPTKLKDLDEYTQNLFLYMNFDPEQLVKDICQNMIEVHYG